MHQSSYTHITCGFSFSNWKHGAHKQLAIATHTRISVHPVHILYSEKQNWSNNQLCSLTHSTRSQLAIQVGSYTMQLLMHCMQILIYVNHSYIHSYMLVIVAEMFGQYTASKSLTYQLGEYVALWGKPIMSPMNSMYHIYIFMQQLDSQPILNTMQLQHLRSFQAYKG